MNKIKTIGSNYTYQTTKPEYEGPIRTTVNIHAIDEDNAVSYLEDLGYTNLVLVPKEKPGPKKVVTEMVVSSSN